MRGKTKSATCKMAMVTCLLMMPVLARAAQAGANAPQADGGLCASRPIPADPHLKFTSCGPANPECRKRGRELIARLRESLEKYRHDYHAAEAAGYKAFYLDVSMPVYRFASRWRAVKERLRFDPTEPTALLYKKTSGGYELTGVMFYGWDFSEGQLDARVPLCVTRWHRQVNVCVSPTAKEVTTDPRFGPDGSISTEAACEKNGGQWNPTIHGWMVEVYPFEDDPDKVWGYRSE